MRTIVLVLTCSSYGPVEKRAEVTTEAARFQGRHVVGITANIQRGSATS